MATTEVAMEHKGQLVVLPVDGASFVADDLLPPATQWAEVFAKFHGVLEAMREFTVNVIVGGDELFRVARQVNRRIALANHRRHQDERRCYAKQARRERTGWRQG